MIAQLELIEKKIEPPQLRDYQVEFIRNIYNEIRKGEKRILGVSGTGSGKTVIASKIVADAVSRNKKVLFIVHLDVLVGQTHDKFAAFGIECGFIKAGWNENKDALVQIASAQTLPRRSWWKEGFVPDVIICDEAHETSWIKVVSDLLDDNENAIVIGLTATPYRLSKKQGMGDKYDVLVAAPTPGELMQRGFLCSPIYYGIKAPDLSKVKTVAGDYSDSGLSDVMNDNEVLQSMLQNWQRLASNRKTIAFAVDVKHSKAIAQTFNSAGIVAEHLDGSTPIHIRHQMFRRLASGETQVLSSCQALQIGFDCPPADCVLMCRPTKSRSIYAQQLGRGLRPFPGKKDCLVLDQAGNVARFGFVEDIKKFSLTKGKESEGDAPVKCCPDCQKILYCFVMECPACGYEFPKKEVDKPTGEMVELKSKAKKPKTNEQEDPLLKEKIDFVKHAMKIVWNKKLKPGWIYYQFIEKFGKQPKREFFINAVFGENPTTEDKDAYWNFLVSKAGDDLNYARKYYSWEFGEKRVETVDNPNTKKISLAIAQFNFNIVIEKVEDEDFNKVQGGIVWKTFLSSVAQQSQPLSALLYQMTAVTQESANLTKDNDIFIKVKSLWYEMVCHRLVDLAQRSIDAA